MTQASSVTASFAPGPYTLTVSIGGGSGGSVGSSPSGIATCTTTCAANYASGVLVTLTATASPGGTFKQWRGACTGTSSTCQVSMSAAKLVTAVFSKTFTDSTLTAGATSIKAVHVTELRAAIAALRSRYDGLLAFTWTDTTLTPGTTSIKRLHLLDLRTALTAVYLAAGNPAPTYADAAITPSLTPIKASHLSELRSLVRSVE